MTWAQFLRQHWGKTPGAYTFSTPPIAITTQECFAALLECAERYRQLTNTVQIRLYVGTHTCSFSEVLSKHLPLASDRDFEGYTDRITWELKGEPFGLIVNGFHKFSPSLSRKIRDFYSNVIRTVQLPFMGFLEPDLFVGKYAKTPFGIHKDAQHVLTHSIIGEKTFRLWPYKAFQDHPIAKGRDLRNTQIPLGVLQEIPHRQDEVLLRATPENYLYWPPEYWHIADSKPMTTVALGFGMTYTEPPIPFFTRIVSEYFSTPAMQKKIKAAEAGKNSKAMQRSMDSILRSLESDAFKIHLESRLFAKEKTLAYKHPSQITGEKILISDTILGDSTIPLAFKRRGDKMLCAAHGKPFTMKYHATLAALFRALNRGKPIQIGSWIRAHRQKTLSQDDILEVVNLLSRYECIRKLDC